MEMPAASRYSAGMNDLVHRARAVLDAGQGERITLAQLARAVGASPYHLQRTFKRRLGLSPLDYQREHRLERAKRLLAGGRPVTEALFEAGFGSVSRFYEKAAGRLGIGARAYRARGKGMTISYTVFGSPLGQVLVARTEKGVCAVKLGDDPAMLARQLAEEFSAATLVRDERALSTTKRSVAEFLAGEGSLARVPLDVRGTVFQRRVWEALRRIPRGETRTYGEIARAIGAPAAARAVGSACGANPVALVVPCHRAVRGDGGLGGYAWGVRRKSTLLRLEREKKSTGPARRGRA
jgi:AraC family transcriptional regulator of adaptative response/methylated-DNA-[protein]-cysteine methyltransferase